MAVAVAVAGGAAAFIIKILSNIISYLPWSYICLPIGGSLQLLIGPHHVSRLWKIKVVCVCVRRFCVACASKGTPAHASSRQQIKWSFSSSKQASKPFWAVHKINNFLEIRLIFYMHNCNFLIQQWKSCSFVSQFNKLFFQRVSQFHSSFSPWLVIALCWQFNTTT